MVIRIEKIKDGHTVQRVELGNDGNFHCYPEGQTLAKYRMLFSTLDEVAAFLISEKRGRVRMNPDWSLIVNHIHIDGVPREQF